MMKRLVIATALVATTALVAGSASPGAAGAAGQGSALSQAANATAGTITTNASATLLGITVPVPGLVTPLLNALVGLPSQVTQPLITGLVTGAGLSAQNASTQLARPASGRYPSCTGGWAAGNCYGPTVPAIGSTGGVVGLTTNALQGYATGDSKGFIGAAHAAGPNLSLLGINIGNLGVIDSTAQCSSATPSLCGTTQTLAGGSLLGGAVTLQVANGTLTATVNGKSLTNGVSVPVVGFGTVTLNGNLLTLALTLSVNSLLNLLGLGSLLSSLTSTSATLTVTIGPGSTTVSGSSAKAWGLDVNASLGLNLTLNLVGLAVVVVSATGSLLDLKLAYSEADAGSLPTAWVPAGLI